jgi:undecaprenyl-diphosphatase
MDLLATSLMSVQSLGHWGYWLVFFVAFAESLVLIGGAVPGMTIIAFFGFMSTRGYLDFNTLIVLAIFGAVLGDNASYYLGLKGKKFFKNENRFLKESHLDKSQVFFARHGNKSIFLGRFIGLIRPMIPFAAGLSKMDYKKFLFWNVTSAIVWAVTTVWVGRILGDAFRLIEVWSTRLAVGIIFIGAIVLLFWFLARSMRSTVTYFGGVLSLVKKYIFSRSEVQNFFQNHPRFSAFLIERLNKNNFTGWPLTVFLLSVIFLVIIFVLLADGVLDYSSIWYLDERFSGFLKFFRDIWVIKLMLGVTVLGEWKAVIIFVALFSFGLFIWNKRPLIWPFLFSIIGSEAVSYAIKYIFNRPRPDGNLAYYFETTPSFPSGHATVALALYGFAFYLVARFAVAKKYFVGIIFSGFLLIFSIGFSRLYLGVHYFSDVVGGYLIGASFLLVAIGFSEWQIRRGRDLKIVNNWSSQTKKIFTGLIVCVFVFFISYNIHFFNPKPLVSENEPVLELVNSDLTLSEIFKKHNLPFYSVGLTGSNHESISFAIWAKNSDDVVKTMNRAGWNRADEPSFSSLWYLSKAVLLDKGYNCAPIAPLFWNTQTNIIAFEKPIDKKNTVRARHRVRLWSTNLISINGYRLYVGTANFDYKVYLGVIHRSDPNIDREKILLWSDLSQAGVLASFRKEKLNIIDSQVTIDDYYITDGYIYNLFLN